MVRENTLLDITIPGFQISTSASDNYCYKQKGRLEAGWVLDVKREIRSCIAFKTKAWY